MKDRPTDSGARSPANTPARKRPGSRATPSAKKPSAVPSRAPSKRTAPPNTRSQMKPDPLTRLAASALKAASSRPVWSIAFSLSLACLCGGVALVVLSLVAFRALAR